MESTELTVNRHGILLDKTSRGFENEGVFNPACVRHNGDVHMFYRAVRNGNYSSVGYCRLDGPTEVAERHEKPLLFPEEPYESQGVEDPRVTKLDGAWYMTYSAYDRMNVLGAYAVSTDLKHFEKKGILSPVFTFREYKHFIECCGNLNEKYLYHYKIFKQHGLGPEISKKLFVWDKNIMFFPKKINGKFTMIHRIHPGIQLVQFDSFDDLNKDFWEDYMMNLSHFIIMDPELPHESSHIGGGAPPIETEHGWLLIYHTAEDTPHGYIYHASAALLDLENPVRLISRLKKPLISPEQSWEKEGYVNNIIFPSGTALFDNELYIYYGAADERVAVASVDINKLLQLLIKNGTR